MKKLTLVLLVIASLILGAMTMASCDASDLPFELPFDVPFLACEHEYVEEVTKAATCTEEGVKTLTCSKCGEVAEEAIPALGHDFATKYTTDVAATCTAEGSKSYHCSRCDAKDGVKAIAKLDHMWSENLVEIEPVTCTVNGKRGYVCEECQAVDESRIEVLYTGGHTMDLFWTVDLEMSCKDNTPGWESRHCQVCDHTEEGREIAVAHDWADEYTLDFAETCTTDGQKSKHCTKCEAVSEPVVIAKHHVMGTETTVKPSSIYAKGSITGPCSVCSTVFTIETTSEIVLLNPAYQNDHREVIKAGSLEGNNGHWTYRESIASLTTETEKYYPTAEDPDGNYLITEVSFLANDTLDYKNAANPYFIFRVQHTTNHNKTNVAYVDEMNDDFTDVCAFAASNSVSSGTAVPAARLEVGWHRLAVMIKQVIIAKDADGGVLELVGGQLADNTKVIASITYEWQYSMYMDGELYGSNVIRGMAKGNNKAGIWDSSNLFYTATVSEDGKTITYADGDKDSYMHFRWECGFMAECDEQAVLTDMSITCGDALVQAVTPVKYNLNGGSVANTYAVEGSELLFPDICYFQVTGADDNPTFTPVRNAYIFDGWTDVDGVQTAQWKLDPNHTEHVVPEAGKQTVFTATIFTEGKTAYTCEICKQVIEEPIAQLEPSSIATSKVDSNNKNWRPFDYSVYSRTENGSDRNTTVSYEDRDLFVEFSLNVNTTGVGLSDACAQLQLYDGNNTKTCTIVMMHNFSTNNIYFRDVVAADASQNIDKADVYLAEGWHRVGIQIREDAEIKQGNVVQTLKYRMFIDGVMINAEGCWTVANSTANSLHLYKATINGDDPTKIDYAPNDLNLKLRFQLSSFFNSSKSTRTIIATDSYYVTSKQVDKTKTDYKYGDLFCMNVTPLESKSVNALQLVYVLGDGALPTKKFIGTGRDGSSTVQNIEYNIPWVTYFQIEGAAPVTAPAPVCEGYTFAGWGEGVVDTVNSKITYTAQWTPVSPAE